MREIIFRGKEKDTPYGALWRYGDLTHHFNSVLINGNVVDPATVGQFTGLKDYDGKEIYEGDILRDTEGRIFQAVWNTGAGAWEFVGSKLHMLFIMTYPDLYKVIGNVHDSPELLEADDERD